MWVRKVLKHGNCKAVTLPVQVRKELMIAEGDKLVITIGRHHQIIMRKLTLRELEQIEELPTIE